MRILWIIGIVLGALFVVKSEWMYQNVGPVAWAEAHLGTEGGSRLFYKLLGIVFIIVSFLGISDTLGGILMSIFGGLFRG